MVSAGLKAGGLLAVLVVLAAYFYKKNTDDVLNERLSTVLSGLLRAEEKVTRQTKSKIAVGFGACLDGFLPAKEVFSRIGLQVEDAEHHHVVNKKPDLAGLFAFFFQHGAAAERYVNNASLWEDIIKAAENYEGTRWSLGGNAAVMARRFAKEGSQVLLGAKMSPKLKDGLSDDVTVADNEDITDPIHLLMEYETGSRWGELTAPRANRLIIHSDKENPLLTSVEEFEKQMLTFQPSLFVLGGLQMMDNFPFKEGEKAARLGRLQQFLKTIPRKTPVHFELASFAEEALFQDIVNDIVPYADSLGMNEQELPNLYSMLTNGTITLISDSHPRVATVLDQMREVYGYLRKTQEVNGQRKLTRLHVHTLAYQAVLITKGSAWKNTMSAAAKASLTASRHVCGSRDVDVAAVRMIMDESFSLSREAGSGRMPLKLDRPVTCWEEEDYTICIAPVLVCTKVIQTGGGGDNISSAGLVLQV